MVDMPEDCERCRLQLMIEYNRLLAWGDAVGLIEVPNGSHVASSLGTNAVELCDILARIAWLLEKFKEINNRWQSSTSPQSEHGLLLREEQARKVDLGKQISGLAATYEANGEKRTQLRATQRLSAWMSRNARNTKDILANPARVRWVMVDKESFEAFLEDLHSLTERIHGLMGDYKVDKIHEITAKTYREMVVMCNDLRELKELLNAATRLMEASGSGLARATTYQANNQETLRDLLRLKALKCASTEVLLQSETDAEVDIDIYLNGAITIPRCNEIALFDHHNSGSKLISAVTSVPQRPRGIITRNGVDYQVWIEWRTAEDLPNGSVQDKQSILRTVALAQMLSLPKPEHFYTPRCIGYVDNRSSQDRFGWIFQMPENSKRDTTLETLHVMLGQQMYKPTLSQRISIAWKLASSLSYLHTTDWLHKGVHSGNVLFQCNGDKIELEKPIMSGFEYSRPRSTKTTSRSLNPRWDIYRWPTIQNDVPKEGTSRKTYDIYSFGLLLLEIAHWQPLHKLLCLKKWPAPSTQDCRIRGWLLNEEPLPPFGKENPLTELRNIAGDRYWKTAMHCLVAHGEGGMRVAEGVSQSQGSGIELQLQDAFTELVVNELKGASI